MGSVLGSRDRIEVLRYQRPLTEIPSSRLSLLVSNLISSLLGTFVQLSILYFIMYIYS